VAIDKIRMRKASRKSERMSSQMIIKNVIIMVENGGYFKVKTRDSSGQIKLS